MFDFKLESDFKDPYVNADVNIYAQDPFKYPADIIDTSDDSSTFDIFDNEASLPDQGDHNEIFGFNLLNFKNMKP